MTLSYSSNEITIASTLLDAFIASPSSYDRIEIVGDINCSGTTTTKTYTSSVPITGSTPVQTSGGVEKIVAAFFGTSTFANGVYSFEVKLYNLVGGVSKDKKCLFIDDGDIFCAIDTDCVEKINYYYILEKSQDCTCNCSKLCELLNNITDTESTNCNCG